MRILHFADLHLGVENYGRLDPATGLSSRLGDFLAAFDELVDYALANDIDLVLFCGDAYRSRDPSQTHQREFARRIRRLAAGGITVFLLVGNHDLPNAVARATAVEIFHTLEIENVVVAHRPATHRIETKSGPIQIVALPWPRRSALLSSDDYKNSSLEEINRKLESVLSERIAAEAEGLDPRLPAILAAHVAFSEAKMGSEQRMTLGRDPVLLRSSVPTHAFDYVALGHMHRPQVLAYHPPMVYAGSLQPVDFGEEGEQKGFYVVALDPEKGLGERIVSYDFQAVKTRRFLTIEVNIDAGDRDPTATVLEAIARRGEEVAESIVRVQIVVPESLEALIQESEVRRALGEAHFIASITKEVEREHRTRLGGRAAEELTPLDALKLYLESKKTPSERVKTLLEYGERLIQQGSAPD